MIDLTQLNVSRRLGEGGQGRAFLATDPEGVRFTVKLVLLDDRADRKLIYSRAARFRTDLLDPSMVPILSYGMLSATPPELARQLGKLSKDALVLVMPFVDGVTLAEVEARGNLTLLEAVAALAGITAALTKRPAGLGHGDLRAPNIFIRPSGEVTLSDPDLSSNPDPALDVRALAAIALNLAKIAAPAEDPLAVDQLRALVGRIAGSGPALDTAEAELKLGEIAVLLGGPSKVTSVLSKRVAATLERPAGPMGAATASTDRGGPRRWMGAAIAGGLLLLAAAALLWNSRPARVPRVQGDESSPAPAPGDSLYDHTGNVHYAEAIHQLGPNELVAESDTFIHFDFEYAIARVAILTPRKDVLWELRTPTAGGSVYLDAKPGHYLVEQDRDRGQLGIQEDVKLVEIDQQHPLRVTTTKEILSAPHRSR